MLVSKGISGGSLKYDLRQKRIEAKEELQKTRTRETTRLPLILGSVRGGRSRNPGTYCFVFLGGGGPKSSPSKFGGMAPQRALRDI